MHGRWLVTDPIRVQVEQQLPVDPRTGFDYITDPANWPSYWPRLVRILGVPRWREPGDRAGLVLRMLGRDVELQMTLVTFEAYRLVEYTSEQRGLPPARHWREFDVRENELYYRIAVEFSPRAGWRRPFDRVVVRRAILRTLRETMRNLERVFATA
jgi:hypothetical protein